MPKPIRVNFPWPYRGMNQNWPVNDQPQLSTPESMNVMTDEPQRGRSRGGSRNGTVKAIANQLGDGTSRRVTGLLQVTKLVDDDGIDGGGGSDLYQLLGNTSLFTGAVGTPEPFEDVISGWTVGSSEADNTPITDYLAQIGATRSGTFIQPPLAIGEFYHSVSAFSYANSTDHGSAAAWRGGNFTSSDSFEVQAQGAMFNEPTYRSFLSCRVKTGDESDTSDVLTVMGWVDDVDFNIHLTLYKGATELLAYQLTVDETNNCNVIGIRVEGDQVSITIGGVAVATTTTSTTASHRGVAFGCFRPDGTSGYGYWQEIRVLDKNTSPDFSVIYSADDFSAYATGQLLEDTGPFDVGTGTPYGPGGVYKNDLRGPLDGIRNDGGPEEAPEDSEGGFMDDDGQPFAQMIAPANSQMTVVRYTDDRAPADSFEVQVKASIPEAGWTSSWAAPSIMARINQADPTDFANVITAFCVQVSYSSIGYPYVIQVGSTIVARGCIAPWDYNVSLRTEPKTMKLRIVGDRVSLLADDYLICEATVTGQNTAHRGVAFANNLLAFYSTEGVRVRSVDVMTPGAGTGGAPPDKVRETRLIVVAGEDVYCGEWGDDSPTKIDNVRTTQRKPALTDINGLVYLVDGENYIKKIDPVAATATNLVASAGSVPLSAYVATNWRSRLVVAGLTGEEQNIYMSRAGDPTDWNYSPGTPNALQAVALNASEAGRIGQPVIALIPWRDDVLVIGCDHGIYQLTGDPAAGGTLDAISEAIGILTRDSWCMSPDGTIYFVGTSGFYRMRPGQPPENLALGKMQPFFQDIDRSSNYVMCAWERDRIGCYIFISPRVEGAENVSLWFDAKQEAFWPIRLPTNQGPLSSIVFDGDGPTDRYTLLGGHDGYVRRFDREADSDDGVAIASYVFLGPICPAGPFGKAKLIETEFTLGVPTNNLDYQLRAGSDAAAALASAADFAASFVTAGRQEKVRSRARGNTFVYRIGNTTVSKAWTLERIDGVFEDGGRQR